MILVEKIIKLRKQNGWFQEDLAMQLNVSRQSVSKWESTASIPDLDKIVKLSEIFGVSTDYLLEISDVCENSYQNATIATHREEYGEDLPPEARKELDDFINYLKFKYKQK